MHHFVLRLDLTDHQRPDNLTAEHAKVREMLGIAMQAIGSSPGRKGEITIPKFDPRRGISDHVAVGSWEFTE
jgi:hypothetical protein